MRTPHPAGWETQPLRFAMRPQSQESVPYRREKKIPIAFAIRSFDPRPYHDEMSTEPKIESSLFYRNNLSKIKLKIDFMPTSFIICNAYLGNDNLHICRVDVQPIEYQ